MQKLAAVGFFALGGLGMLILWWLRRPKQDHSGAMRSANSASSPNRLEQLETIDATPDEPVAFGYKIQWLAIRSTEPDYVSRVIELENGQPANWETGLTAAYKGWTFVSPAVEGWVFVVGCKLPCPDSAERLAAWESWMRPIAAKFSHVHYFGSHRVVGLHAWARFVNGQESRVYCYVGEQGRTAVDRGTRAAAEQDWSAADEDDNGGCLPDEADVLRVAAEWGVNPMSLEDRDYPTGVGWVGLLGRRNTMERC